MNRQFEKERTLIILKPDTIQRGLVGEVLSRIERTGLKFTAFKFFVPTREQVLAHYNKDDAWCERKGQGVVEQLTARGVVVDKPAIEYGRDIMEGNVKFMTAGPVLAAVVEGNQAVGVVVKHVGTTEPKTADIGTIRGDLTVDSYSHATYRSSAVRNLIHCSESPEEAEREIQVWFSENDIMNYKTVWEKILYDVNLDGILE
jgi:nucleoside-diphosphate kinase